MAGPRLSPEALARLRAQFPPVGYLSPMMPWESPQFVPGAPHNLPSKGDRPNQHGYLIGGGQSLLSEDSGLVDFSMPSFPSTALQSPLPNEVPSSGPLTIPDKQIIRDPHHYANIIGNTIPVDAASTGVFLSSPITRRNFLSLRNAGATVIFIDYGKDPTAQSWCAIPAGGLIIFDVVVPQDDLYALSSAAGGVLSFGYSTIAG